MCVFTAGFISTQQTAAGAEHRGVGWERHKRYSQSSFMLLKQQQHTKLYGQYGLYITTQGHPLTSPPPYVIKRVRWVSTPSAGSAGSFLWACKVLWVDKPQKHSWSITSGGGCYVTLPGNRKEQEVGGSADWGLFQLIIVPPAPRDFPGGLTQRHLLLTPPACF